MLSLLAATYNIQDMILTTEADNRSVNVQCVFVSGATADGCHVIVNNTKTGIINYLYIRTNKTIQLTSGYYIVTIYELSNGIKWSCVQPKQFAISLPLYSSNTWGKIFLKLPCIHVCLASYSNCYYIYFN